MNGNARDGREERKFKEEKEGEMEARGEEKGENGMEYRDRKDTIEYKQ